MTDLNTQMTPEAMMQAQIERLKRNNDALHKSLDTVLSEGAKQKSRAEKAERELAEHRAQTDALIAAAYEDAAEACEDYPRAARIQEDMDDGMDG